MESTQLVQKISDLVTVNVRHDFTPEEMAEQSQLLAKAVQDKSHVEAEKKIVVKGFQDRIALHDKEIKDFSNKVTNGFAYIDLPAEMYLDYAQEKRLYYDKRDGKLLKEENFKESDYQTKINFEAKQKQIAENNAAGDFAEGEEQFPEGDALDQVINEKIAESGKGKGPKKEKPTPKDNLPEQYGKDYEHESLPEGMRPDRNGNLTDIPGDDEDDDLFASEGSDQLPGQ